MKPEGLRKVKLTSEATCAHIYVDGEEVHGVRSIEFSQSVDTVPLVKIETISEFEMDVEYVSAVDRVRKEMCDSYCRYIKGMGVCENCPLRGL